MPCTYDDSYDRNEELNKVTRLLCSVMKILRKGPDSQYENVIANVPDLGEWWHEHSKKDEKRIYIEAIAKLSAEELRVLGLEETP